jgi:hypothetical protein
MARDWSAPFSLLFSYFVVEWLSLQWSASSSTLLTRTCKGRACGVLLVCAELVELLAPLFSVSFGLTAVPVTAIS